MPGAARVAPTELLFFTFCDFYKRAGPTALSLSEHFGKLRTSVWDGLPVPTGRKKSSRWFQPPVPYPNTGQSHLFERRPESRRDDITRPEICRPFGTDPAISISCPVTEVTGYSYSVPSGLGSAFRRATVPSRGLLAHCLQACSTEPSGSVW